MGANSEKLARRLEKEGTKNITFFESVPSNAWAAQVYADGAAWNLQELFTHIVEAEDSVLRLIEGVAKTGRGVPDDFDLNKYNEHKVRAAGIISPESLIKKFRERRGRTVSATLAFDDTDLEKEGEHPFLGNANVKDMLKLMYLHVQLHIRDIKRVVDEL